MNETAANSGAGAAGAMGGGAMLVWLIVSVLLIASLWKIFTKAGQPGWASIIPIYNLVVFLQTAGKPGWWVLLFFIPLVNVIIYIIATVALAAKFGKGAGYAVGMLLLSVIFYPMLAFGSATYQGSAAT